MKLVVASCAAITACYSGIPTGLDGITVAPVGNSKDHIAMAPCVRPDEVSAWARVAIPALLSEIDRQGYIKNPDISGLRLCLVEEPEPCCMGGWPCAGPCEQVAGTGNQVRCARKAGCSLANRRDAWAWASAKWPGECSAGWPAEPNCGPAVTGWDWRRGLVHEVANTIVKRYGLSERYTDKTATEFYGTNGPDQVVQRRLFP